MGTATTTDTVTDWFSAPTGRDLVGQEIARCAELVPAGYFPHGLQVGFPGDDYLAEMAVTHRCQVETKPAQPLGEPGDSPPLTVRAVPEALPFPEKSMDIVALPHTLDFCRSPHEVLRQVSQVLVPNGYVVITGFNIISLYGLIRLCRRGSGRLPWCGHYYSLRRVQDWLSLLGFDLAGAGMMAWAPPVQSGTWRSRLAFIEKAGDRWGPGLGGVYVIVGRKREMAVTPLPGSWRRWRAFLPGMAQPAAQRAARIGIRLVPGTTDTPAGRP